MDTSCPHIAPADPTPHLPMDVAIPPITPVKPPFSSDSSADADYLRPTVPPIAPVEPGWTKLDLVAIFNLL